MYCSLETRAPLLNHRIAEFAASLPMQLLSRDGSSKWLLRKVLSRYLPSKLFDRPKMGFGVPLGSWMRGPLRPWCEDLLSAARHVDSKPLDRAAVQRLWSQHLSGTYDHTSQLWSIFSFLAWSISDRNGRNAPKAF